MRLIVPCSGERASFLLSSCWSEQYPDSPEVQVSVGINQSAPASAPDSDRTPGKISFSELVVEFRVRESQIRALESDPWLVHQDSCVEFFFSAPNSRTYYNLEANPAGLFLLACGEEREGRRDLTGTAGRHITIEGSHVGRKAFEDPGGDWNLTMRIPGAVLDGFDSWGAELDGVTANFYKCGDSLRRPHYQAWCPPVSEYPDYHRPQDFGVIGFR